MGTASAAAGRFALVQKAGIDVIGRGLLFLPVSRIHCKRVFAVCLRKMQDLPYQVAAPALAWSKTFGAPEDAT